MRHSRRSFLSATAAGVAMLTSGCFPREPDGADLKSIKSVDVVPSAREPLRFSYDGGTGYLANAAVSGAPAALGLAAGAAASWQRKFESAFRGQMPDFFGALDAAVIRSLRAKGYDADIATPDRRSDTRFSVTFTQIGVGYAVAFDGKAIVPHASMIVRITRTADERLLAVNAFLFGGGGWGTIPKIVASPALRINSVDEFLSNPARSATLSLAAAEEIAPHITRVLNR